MQPFLLTVGYQNEFRVHPSYRCPRLSGRIVRNKYPTWSSSDSPGFELTCQMLEDHFEVDRWGYS